MRAPVWVVKVRGVGTRSVDLYLTAEGKWSASAKDAVRFPVKPRAVRLVPRKRGGQ